LMRPADRPAVLLDGFGGAFRGEAGDVVHAVNRERKHTSHLSDIDRGKVLDRSVEMCGQGISNLMYFDQGFEHPRGIPGANPIATDIR